MNDIARQPIADLFDIYPRTIATRIGELRLVSAHGGHTSDSPFAQLASAYGLPCDGLTYMDDTERKGCHLVAVFYGETEGQTAIAVCHDWKWQWYVGEGVEVAMAVRLCIKGVRGEDAPPAGTTVGDLARKG